MTQYQMPKNCANKTTFALDVDEVGIVPHCTEIQKQTDKRNLYATPAQDEPVYESPLSLVEQLNANSTETRESAEKRGPRSKTNDLYEATNDETLLNGRRYTGYSYVTNTENLIPRTRAAYDNPVAAMEDGHEYEESFRNSRFSTNVVYEDTNCPKRLTIQGVRDTKTGSSSRHLYVEKRSGKHRASLLQILTLLWSIVACIIAVLALLQATGKVKLDNAETESVVNPAALTSQEPQDKDGLPNTERIESSKENYTELQEKYIIMTKQVETSKQNYTELLVKYNLMTEQLNDLYLKLERVEKINSSLNSQLGRVDSNFHSLGKKLATVDDKVEKMTNANQYLNNTLKSINWKFTVQLRNVSKQLGPRGFNGTQGPQGLPGIQGPQGEPGVGGNLTACRVGEKSDLGVVNSDLDKVTTSYESKAGWKVISAVCTTKVKAGAIHTVLSLNNNKYQCSCAGKSTYSSFKPLKDTDGNTKLYCGIIYWECPERT